MRLSVTFCMLFTSPSIWAQLAPAGTIFTESRPGGSPALYTSQWPTRLETNATTTLVNYTGGQPGYINNIYLCIGLGKVTASTFGNISVYVDGERFPSISTTLGHFFFANCVTCGIPPAFTTRFFGAWPNLPDNSVSYYSFIPIPFSSSIKITWKNPGPPVYFASTVRYNVGVPNTWTRTRHLRASTGVLINQPMDTVVTLVDASGLNPGMYLGTYMWVDAHPNGANPVAAALEGNHKMYLDDAITPSLEWSGFEDYFLHGYYFSLSQPDETMFNTPYSRSVSDYVGLTFKSYAVGTFAAYRLHIPDPIWFSNALKFTWDVGDSKQINFTGGERVEWRVWYYTE